MTCPTRDQWALLSMNLLESWEVCEFEEHLAACDACKKQFAQARRDHASLVRTYEALDQDHDELREKLITTLPSEPPLPTRVGTIRLARRLGEKMMTNPKVRYTTATLSAAACLTVAFVLVGGSTQSMALDKIGHAIQEAGSMTSRLALSITGGSAPMTMDGKMYLSAEHGSRTDIFSSGELFITTIQPIEGPAVSGRPGGPASFRVTREDPTTRDPSNFTPGEYIQKLQELTGEAKTELGTGVIEGQSVLGFEIDGDAFGLSAMRPSQDADGGTPLASVELWVNEETLLPVRYTISMPSVEEGSTMTVVCDQFRWDVELEASLFDTAIFDGDEPPKFDFKIPAATEDALITGLRSFSEIVKGEYPSALDFTRIMTDFYKKGSAADEETKKSLKGTDGPQALMDKFMPLYAGTIFFQKMVASGNTAEYFGPDVTPGDGEAILVRWQLETGEWRVIFGDLRIETLPADEE